MNVHALFSAVEGIGTIATLGPASGESVQRGANCTSREIDLGSGRDGGGDRRNDRRTHRRDRDTRAGAACPDTAQERTWVVSASSERRTRTASACTTEAAACRSASDADARTVQASADGRRSRAACRARGSSNRHDRETCRRCIRYSNDFVRAYPPGSLRCRGAASYDPKESYCLG